MSTCKISLIEKKTFVIVLCSLFFVLSSCKPIPNPKTDFFTWAKKGEVIQKVVCKNIQAYDYCLYLPSFYKIDKTWPIIYCFDPHGDGSIPVKLLQTYAEKKGYILVGSNNSKNGTSANELQEIISELLTDTKIKLAINKQRIYLLGFSGGARVACSIALTYPDIAGVIACSAGYTPSPGQNSFNIIGIAGMRDMNYLEMHKLNEALDAYPAQHLFISYDAKHQWPTKDILEKAMQCFEIIAMSQGKIPIETELVKQNYIEALHEINNCKSSNNVDSLLRTTELISNAKSVFSQLVNTNELNEIEKSLNQNANFLNAKKSEERLLFSENSCQELYSKAMTAQSPAWWKSEINKLNKDAKQTSLDGIVASRLLAFISLMSYSYVNSAIHQQNWSAADRFLQTYGLADPENPDYFFFRAVYNAQMNQNELAVDALEHAVKYGFKDVNKLNNPVFANLQSLPAFSKIKEEIVK